MIIRFYYIFTLSSACENSAVRNRRHTTAGVMDDLPDLWEADVFWIPVQPSDHGAVEPLSHPGQRWEQLRAQRHQGQLGEKECRAGSRLWRRLFFQFEDICWPKLPVKSKQVSECTLSQSVE